MSIKQKKNHVFVLYFSAKLNDCVLLRNGNKNVPFCRSNRHETNRLQTEQTIQTMNSHLCLFWKKKNKEKGRPKSNLDDLNTPTIQPIKWTISKSPLKLINIISECFYEQIVWFCERKCDNILFFKEIYKFALVSTICY